ncbi:MAG: hypothetical protein ACRDN9_05740 [Streptosporangiaceae bacterium]
MPSPTVGREPPQFMRVSGRLAAVSAERGTRVPGRRRRAERGRRTNAVLADTIMGESALAPERLVAGDRTA